ncbi:MAG: iron ABC transporter permease, partial [Alphaproteobacteria bacterium]
VQYFGVHTFTTAIYRTWFGMGDRVGAAQLATGLLSFMLLLVAVEMLSRRDRRYGGDARRHRGVTALVLTGPKAAGALLFCALPVILGFLLPVLALVRLHLDDGDPVFGARFLVYARNSFLLAGMAAVIIVTAAAALAYATRLAPASAGIVRIAALGYALPGTVIAVGILVPLGAFDNALDSFARAQFGVSTGLILSGSVIGLLYAYLVRFLAVAIGPLETGLGKIPLSIDQAARTLGLAASGVASRIHAPLLRRSMLTAGLMVFVDVLKELPATLIVRPFDFDTLAVRVYNLAADERLAQASTGALVIVAIGLLPVVVLTRMIAQDRRLGERGPPQ